jgi:hypothetical protein
VIWYTKKVPIGDVIRYLTKIEQEAIMEQIKQLEGKEIELEGDIIQIKKLAERYGLSTDAVKASVKDHEYVVFKDVIVKKELLRKIKAKLTAMEKYVEARRIIEEAGLPNADEVLAHLGFRVQWKELDVNEARIGPD